MAEEHQQLRQDLLPHLPLELDQAAEAARKQRKSQSTWMWFHGSVRSGNVRRFDLHVYTGAQLGYIFGLLQLFAQSQELHTEPMA